MNEIASVRLGPKTLRTLDEEVKSLVSAWRLTAISLSKDCQRLSTVITRETFGHQRFARAHAHKSRIHADKRFLDEGLINEVLKLQLLLIDY